MTHTPPRDGDSRRRADTTRRSVGVSRRQLLAGVGTVGVASLGAGLGTTAFFTDREVTTATLDGGTLDLRLDYRAAYRPGDRRTDFGSDPDADRIPDSGGLVVLEQVPDLRYEDGPREGRPFSEGDWGDAVREIPCDDTRLVDGSVPTIFDLGDVKPGDEGEITTSLHLCGNPAYLWLRTTETVDADGPEDGSMPALTEPEVVAGDDGEGPLVAGELDDYLYVEVWYDTDCDNRYDDEEALLYRGSLDGFLGLAETGYPLAPSRAVADEQDSDASDLSPVVGDLDGCTPLTKIEWDESAGRFTTADKDDAGERALDLGEGDTLAVVYDEDAEPILLELSDFVWKGEGGGEDGDEGEITAFDFRVLTPGFGVCAVAVKAGSDRQGGRGGRGGPGNAGGTETFEFACARSGTVDTDDLGGKGISNVRFSLCPRPSVPPVGDPDGECVQPGVVCLGLRWYLPTGADEDGERFADFPSDVAGTLAEELRTKGLPTDADAINVIQTDVVGFETEYVAIQCRHNADNPNPFTLGL
ncbi:CalY family protein [Salinirubrum litoreum]|uniref:CalY family protein n=1 Tax=Salinirubrum litoreum TaxID=1126234 RepID=A0ABD5RA14_9EURY|nr:CalY family protein [Salinirubrum litoreum]